MKHMDNPAMGMEGHNHHDHAGMIADFKKRFYCSAGTNNTDHVVINHDTTFYRS